MEDLTGKVFVVTGGGTGIGFAISEQLAARGARVVMASRSASHLESAAEHLKEQGTDADHRVLDVRDPQQVDEVITSVTDDYGRLDGLVNNAAGNFVAPAEKISANGWRAVIDIVLNGTWNCTSAAARWWIEQQQPGAVLNTVATYAWTGHPGTVHSAAAKAGVVTMTRTLAVEWAPYGIRLNCLAPGPTDTDGAGAALWADDSALAGVLNSVPMHRLATPTEVGDIAAFLLSDRAGYITGEVLTADGGQWLGKQVYGQADAAASPGRGRS